MRDEQKENVAMTPPSDRLLQSELTECAEEVEVQDSVRDEEMEAQRVLTTRDLCSRFS